jgi:xylulokinase
MYLGIDLGTSGVKAVLLDTDHRVRAVADAPLAVSRPQPSWSEQNPDDWWAATVQTIAKLRETAPQVLGAVRAIGLSGQMHGAVALDAQHAVIRPAILWNDGRAMAQCATIETREPRSRAITGNLAMPGFTAPKLVWMREHEPTRFARTKTVLLPKDWLRFKLTGELVSEMSDASGTMWLDVGARDWSEPMLAACGLNRTHMPRLVEGSAIAGTLTHALAQQWGLSANVIVAGGAGDNAASAIGLGIARAGEGFVSLGTSGVIFRATDQFMPNPAQAVHAFAHALPHRWHQMSVMLSAASALSWAAALTGAESEAALLARTDTLTPAQRRNAPIFLPYLSGERTPHNNPDATGALLGLRHEHLSADIAHAVMEGVSFGLLDGWLAMNPHATPAESPGLALVGGGARSDAWAQWLASTLNVPLHRVEGAHAAAAIGAARLAWLADGGTQDEVCKRAQIERSFLPSAGQREMLLPRYEQFRRQYGKLF